jgi:type II secretory pathway pseudopilin PulG
LTGRLRDRDGQAGITVMEMTVVVALLGLVLAVAVQGLSSYQGAVVASDSRLQNLEQAQVAMAVLTKDLRTATSFSTVAATSTTFLGHLNTGATAPPNRLRLYVDAQGVLREATTPPDNPNASPITYTGAPSVRVVARGLVNTGSLFSFRDTTDNPTTTPSAVASVVVTVSVDLPSGSPVPPTVLTSRVFLPNIAAATGA